MSYNIIFLKKKCYWQRSTSQVKRPINDILKENICNIDKGLLFLIYKELFQVKENKRPTTIKRLDKRVEQTIHEKRHTNDA